MTAKFTRSSGNLFADLGFAAPEAVALRLRSQLMIEIRRQIEGRGLTQKAAADWLGVSQPRVSDLIRGHIDKFSVDGLIEMLGRAGLELDCKVQEAPSFNPIVQEFDMTVPADFRAPVSVWTAGPIQPSGLPQAINQDYAAAA